MSRSWRRITTVVIGAASLVASSPADARADDTGDPGRTGALVASSIGFGLGVPITAFGVFASQLSPCEHSSCVQSDAGRNEWLAAYAVHVVIVPSIPRMVVGDWAGAALFGGGRAALLGLAVLSSHSESSGSAGIAFAGVLFPIAVGIVDLATTPRRAVREEESKERSIGFAPAPVFTRGDLTGGMVTVGGAF